MNIDVVGRIRQSLRGEGPQSLHITSGNRVYSHRGGTSHGFSVLYKQDAGNYEIYKKSVEPLLDLLVAGFNTSIMTFGESFSGKSFTLAGEGSQKSGLVPLLIDGLFARIAEENRKENVGRSAVQVSIMMVEVYDEKIRDLLQLPKANPDYLDIGESAEEGYFVQDCKWVYSNTASEATRAFRDGWSRRSHAITDFGPSYHYTSVIFQIELSLISGDNPAPNRSKFVIANLPAAEKLSEDFHQLRMREGPTLNKSLLALSYLVGSIANTQLAERVLNFSESKLTKILAEPLSGNFKTRVITTFRPHSDPAVLASILRTASLFSQCRTYPIMNDNFAQGLQTQYRAKILSLSSELGMAPDVGLPNANQVKDELRRLKNENLHLRDKNERLYHKLESLQSKLSDLAVSKRDISSNYVMSEEEKLKVSKALVDLQIDNNAAKEEAEQMKFELSNKTLLLENQLMQCKLERDKLEHQVKETKVKLSELEINRKTLADEFVALKSNYMSLTKDYDVEVSRNEELTTELLNIINTKEMLLRERSRFEKSGIMDQFALATSDLERTKNLLNRIASKRLYDSDKSFPIPRDVLRPERNLFGDVEKFNRELDRIRVMYDQEQAQLEGRLQALARDLEDARQSSRTAQKKMAETASELFHAKSIQKELETDNNKLQNKLKDLNEEYKTRLVRYVEDIAEYIDSTRTQSEKNLKLKAYMEAMLKDIKRAAKTREEQLADAVKKYKNISKKVLKRHEELLVAYRLLRTQIINLDYEIEIGPDQFDLYITDDDLKLDNSSDLGKLSRALKEAQDEIRRLKETVSISPRKTTTRVSEEMDLAKATLRDYTKNQIIALEAEKAAALARATVAEEQLAETQDYIDKHLIRYKDEIMRLRRMLKSNQAAALRATRDYMMTASSDDSKL